MTEFWVSQGNKWCDYCKIFIANNAASIRTHELGQRHKEAVTKRLASMRKQSVEEKRQKEQAEKDIKRIEQMAMAQYKKDMAQQQVAAHAVHPPGKSTPPRTTAKAGDGEEWVLEEGTGYYYNSATGYHYDANSGLYYSPALGKWTTEADARVASLKPVDIALPKALVKGRVTGKPGAPSSSPAKTAVPVAGKVSGAKAGRSVKVVGKKSSVTVVKRKREDEGVARLASSDAEKQALAAREGAKQRMLARTAKSRGYA